MPKFIVTVVRAQQTTIVVEAADERAAGRLVSAMSEDDLVDRVRDWDIMPGTHFPAQVDEWPEESDGR